jgi:hypothetical protein
VVVGVEGTVMVSGLILTTAALSTTMVGAVGRVVGTAAIATLVDVAAAAEATASPLLAAAAASCSFTAACDKGKQKWLGLGLGVRV